MYKKSIIDYEGSYYTNDGELFSWKEVKTRNFTLEDVTNKFELADIVKHIGINKLENFIRKQKIDRLKKLSK